MNPPSHVRRPGVCGIHLCPPCGLPARLYRTGWQCDPPDTRSTHPLTPEPEEATTS